MKVKSTMQRLAAMIEFVVAVGIIIFFHMVLEEKEAALSIFGIGMLISLASWLLREDLIGVRGIGGSPLTSDPGDILSLPRQDRMSPKS